MTRPNNISTQPVTLRTNSENQVIVYAKQHDNNLRELLVDMRDFFGRIPSDISVRLNATLQDDSHIYLDGVIKDDYTVSIMLTNILLAEEGDVQCDVSFFDASGDLLLTTETFVIKVAASNYDPAATDAGEGTPMPVVYVRYDVAQDLTDEQKETARNNIGAVDEGDVEEIIEPLIVGYNGEITLSGDETLVLEIKSGRLYHDNALYTGDIVFSDDGDNAVTLNVNKGFVYSEGALYTDTVKLSGDDSTLFISFESGLVKNITTDNPNLDGTVHYDGEQTLTNEQKETARKNIGIDDEINKFGVALIYAGSQIEVGMDCIYPVEFIDGTIPHTYLLYLGEDGIDPLTMYPSIPPQSDFGVTLKGNQIACSRDGIHYGAKDENDNAVNFTIESFEYEGNIYFLLIESV